MAYEIQIKQMEQALNDLENEVEALHTENERLANLSVQRLTQLQELKLNSNEENHKLEVYELRNQIELLKSQSYDVRQLAIQHSSDRAADQAKMNELTQLNHNLQNDIEKLKNVIQQRKADAESLTQQVTKNTFMSNLY